jgi:hypothetical protein
MKIHKSPLFRFFLPTVIGFVLGWAFWFTELPYLLPDEWMLWLEMPALMVAAGLQSSLQLIQILGVFQWTFLGLCIGTCWLFFGKADGVRWHMRAKRTILSFASCVILVSIVSFLYFGLYNPNSWDHVPAPNMSRPGAMTSVSEFIAAHGWYMSTNQDDLWRWEDLNTPSISNLPWRRYKNQQFPALTYNGILYVLSDPGWHHDYAGVAYNPTTNEFPAELDGFKPIGGHWYVWCILEFHPSDLPKKYE